MTIPDNAESKVVGMYTYLKGSDNEWYVELNSTYYKVEPIKWRVLTTNYDHDGNPATAGKKLLLAENILINCIYYEYYSVNRIIRLQTISPNNYEHSRIRAYLNGLSYKIKSSDSANQTTDSTLVGKGFLQTAFTTKEQTAIIKTTVVNSARSTNPDANAIKWNNGNNQYASDTPTLDKIFLLSQQEITTESYGFALDYQYGSGSTRIRFPTAFAKDSGVYQSTTENYGGFWWQRSPNPNCNNRDYYVRTVQSSGDARHNNTVGYDDLGVVPALCLN